MRSYIPRGECLEMYSIKMRTLKIIFFGLATLYLYNHLLFLYFVPTSVVGVLRNASKLCRQLIFKIKEEGRDLILG